LEQNAKDDKKIPHPISPKIVVVGKNIFFICGSGAFDLSIKPIIHKKTFL